MDLEKCELAVKKERANLTLKRTKSVDVILSMAS